MWLLRGQQKNVANARKIEVNFFFILDNRKWKTFCHKYDNGKLWVEVITS